MSWLHDLQLWFVVYEKQLSILINMIGLFGADSVIIREHIKIDYIYTTFSYRKLLKTDP